MNKRFIKLCFFLLLISCASFSFASETNGTISGANKFGWGENIGWINFAPTNGSEYVGLTVTDAAVTGFAWSSQFGWINFSPTGSGQGVLNTAEGHLSGSAWAAELGWISFDGVSIDDSGQFKGIAGTEGSGAGRISFDCGQCSVQTDWRPLSARHSANLLSNHFTISGGVLSFGASGGENENSLQTESPTKPSNEQRIAIANNIVPATAPDGSAGNASFVQLPVAAIAASLDGTNNTPSTLFDVAIEPAAVLSQSMPLPFFILLAAIILFIFFLVRRRAKYRWRHKKEALSFRHKQS